MAKQETGISVEDFAISSSFKFDSNPQWNRNNNECFYCNKKIYYTRNCNKRKNEKKDINSQKAKQAPWQKAQNN